MIVGGFSIMKIHYLVTTVILFCLSVNPAQSKECVLTQKVCAEGAGERVIEGRKIYKDCWKYEKLFQCSGYSTNNCEALRKDGCVQVGSKCKEYRGQWCVNYEKDYKCEKIENHKIKETRYRIPKFQSTDFDNRRSIKCGEKIKCVDGKCFYQVDQTNNELGEAIAMLNTMKEMQTQNSTKPLTVFKGEADWCKRKALGLNNCCTEGKALVEKLHLSECTAEDKSLIEKREKNLCHFVGKYTKKIKSTPLVDYKKYSYCCFPSKLVKIIQIQGKAQLGKGFGSPKNPDCGGLTVEELQAIDFSKINFSPVFEDIFKSQKTHEIKRVQEVLENEMRIIQDDLHKGEPAKIDGQNKKFNDEGIL